MTSLLCTGRVGERDRDRPLKTQRWRFWLGEPSIPMKYPHPCACQAFLRSAVAKAGAGEAKGHLGNATAS